MILSNVAITESDVPKVTGDVQTKGPRGVFKIVAQGGVVCLAACSLSLLGVEEASAAEGSYPGCPTLGFNSSGPCVEQLQRDLISSGDADPQIEVDGLYGLLTEKAVAHLETRYNQDPDGVFGPIGFQLIQDSLTVGTPSPALAPSDFHPARAAAFAIENAGLTSAPWRSPGGDHCTEFVSISVNAAGLKMDDTWYPFWEAPKRASLWQNVKNAAQFAKGDPVPSSPAWDNSFDFSDYFVSKGWVDKIDLDPADPESPYKNGARLGDVVVYDWLGHGDSANGHVAMVTGYAENNVIVSQQGLGDEAQNQVYRQWDYSTVDNQRLIDGWPNMHAWLLRWKR